MYLSFCWMDLMRDLYILDSHPGCKCAPDSINDILKDAFTPDRSNVLKTQLNGNYKIGDLFKL